MKDWGSGRSDINAGRRGRYPAASNLSQPPANMHFSTGIFLLVSPGERPETRLILAYTFTLYWQCSTAYYTFAEVIRSSIRRANGN